MTQSCRSGMRAGKFHVQISRARTLGMFRKLDVPRMPRSEATACQPVEEAVVVVERAAPRCKSVEVADTLAAAAALLTPRPRTAALPSSRLPTPHHSAAVEDAGASTGNFDTGNKFTS